MVLLYKYLMSYQMENQFNDYLEYYYSTEEYQYSECQSVCSMDRSDFESKDDYVVYLVSKGKDYTYDEDGYKIPKVDLCGYIRYPKDEDYIDKFNPNKLSMWRTEDCYVNFWNKYFENFYNDDHPESKDADLFKTYQEFYKVVQSIKENRYALDDYDSCSQYWKDLEEEFAEFERSCEPEEPLKYTKVKPSIVKYISKHQLKTLPDYAQKHFNQKIVTNKTIKAPSTKRQQKKAPKMKDIKIFL